MCLSIRKPFPYSMLEISLLAKVPEFGTRLWVFPDTLARSTQDGFLGRGGSGGTKEGSSQESRGEE